VQAPSLSNSAPLKHTGPRCLCSPIQAPFPLSGSMVLGGSPPRQALQPGVHGANVLHSIPLPQAPSAQSISLGPGSSSRSPQQLPQRRPPLPQVRQPSPTKLLPWRCYLQDGARHPKGWNPTLSLFPSISSSPGVSFCPAEIPPGHWRSQARAGARQGLTDALSMAGFKQWVEPLFLPWHLTPALLCPTTPSLSTGAGTLCISLAQEIPKCRRPGLPWPLASPCNRAPLLPSHGLASGVHRAPPRSSSPLLLWPVTPSGGSSSCHVGRRSFSPATVEPAWTRSALCSSASPQQQPRHPLCIMPSACSM
jgi:hypothetical protein